MTSLPKCPSPPTAYTKYAVVWGIKNWKHMKTFHNNDKKKSNYVTEKRNNGKWCLNQFCYIISILVLINENWNYITKFKSNDLESDVKFGGWF